MPASCIGFYFPWNIPADNPKNQDEFHCEEHCDHDRCVLIEQRIDHGD